MNKVQLNSSQIELAKTWLPPASYPYAYSPTNGMMWYWQTYYNGLPIKGCTKLSIDQLAQLDKLS